MEEYVNYSVNDFLDLIISLDIEKTRLMESHAKVLQTIKDIEETRNNIIEYMKEEYTNNA